MSRIPCLVRKEFLQLRRDRRMIPLLLFAPIIQTALMGYAANLDVKNIPLVVCDGDNSRPSRALVRKLEASGYFQVVDRVARLDQIRHPIDRGDASAALVLPPGMARDLGRQVPVALQFIVDGTDSMSATIGLAYAGAIVADAAQQMLGERSPLLRLAPISHQPRVWYNPELRSRRFMVPAVVAMVLLVVTAMLTAMAVVKERERGTIEQLIVTPVTPRELVLGKFLPFVVIGMIDIGLVTGLAALLFDLRAQGSLLLLFALALLFLLNTLGIGLLFSTLSQTQQQAMLGLFFTLLPMILLSGFVFPIASMPEAVQYFTYLIPLRYFLVIVRGIFLKGVGMAELWPQAVGLAVLGVSILGLSIARFRKRL
jgi:ABC-2 type transport system permease protein